MILPYTVLCLSKIDSESGETLEDRQRLLAKRLEEAVKDEVPSDEIQDEDEAEHERLLELETEVSKRKADAANTTSSYQPHLDDDNNGGAEDSLALSPEERQLFEKENERLYGDLISVQDEVQQVETKVVKIAELQEIFTEKVLQQSEEVETISRNAVTATENVKDGNEEIRKYGFYCFM